MKHRARKRFGQNFLIDGHVIDAIVAAVAPRPDQHVIEIGPGQAALTSQLAASGCRLSVIEIDRDLAAALRMRTDLAGAEIIEEDALNVDLGRFDGPVRLVGNLPYNVSTPILFWALGQITRIRDMHFMLQREVVERMAAPPGTKAYGRLSVMLQYHCTVEPVLEVPPEAFRPRPSVNSSVARLTPREPAVRARDLERLEAVVKQAFSSRRKTLANTLKPLFSRQQLIDAGIDPGLRAERLTVAEFVALANRPEPHG